jgi:transposase
MPSVRYTITEFMADFPDNETCLVWLWNTRYDLGDNRAHCERCGEIRTFKRYAAKQHRKDWTCTTCGLHVFPTAGTTFQKSSTDLGKWFYAMYLMTSTRCSISGKQLERELGVPYNTARRMRQAIRHELTA